VDFTRLAGLGTSAARQGDFGQWLDAQIVGLNRDLQRSDELVRQLATGRSGNLHHIMIELEKAKLNFELVMQVRNKALDAYREIIRMQL
jgi:flagellar hook-basal body complex protein FliE